MARVERASVITGYRAEIDWSAIGYGQVVILSVRAAPDHDVSSIMVALWEMAEAEDVTLVTGDLDFLVRMRVRDYAHLRQLLMDQVWQIVGMQRTATLLAVAEMPAKDFGMGLLRKIDLGRHSMTSSTAAHRPLEGIRVVDLTSNIAAPFAGLLAGREPEQASDHA